MIWFTADEHYYHSNIVAPRSVDDRHFKSVAKMNEYIIKRHNDVVTKDDIVYHLGDFSFVRTYKEMAHTLARLHGRHILILGNHDLFKWFEYLEVGFESVHSSLTLPLKDNITLNLVHDPAIAGVFRDRLYVHGHTHNLGRFLSSHAYCVSVEVSDYAPVPITAVQDWAQRCG